LFKNGFGFLNLLFFIILIAGNESNFIFSKNSTKLSKVVNNIDGDGDKENRIGIKCYVKMVLSNKDYFFLLFE